MVRRCIGGYRLDCGISSTRPEARASGVGVCCSLPWRFTGSPSWVLNYHKFLLWPGLVLAMAGALLGLAGAASRSRRITAAGGSFVCLGTAVVSVCFRGLWQWTIPLFAAMFIAGRRGGRIDAASKLPPIVGVATLVALAGIIRVADNGNYPHGVSGHALGHMWESHRDFHIILSGNLPDGPPVGSVCTAGLLYALTKGGISSMYVIDMATLPFLGWQHHNRRLAAAIISLLTIPPLYYAGRRLYGKRAGITAAA